MAERTYFGLEIISGRGVRPADIANLPFADFWCDSATYSTQIKDKASGEWLVYLTDWKNFAKMFIETGRHRNMPRLPEVLWFHRDEDEPERTFFGLEIVLAKLVRERDIAALPFCAFWRDSSKGSTFGVDQNTGEHLISLHNRRAFAQLFIKTGCHRWMSHPENET